MIGIYKIKNLINGKSYIGQALDIEKRWKEHRYTIEKGGQVIYRAIRKHGIENFLFEVVEECTENQLDELEIFYILYHNSYFKWENGGYNMTLGGGGKRGYVVNEETRKKIGRAHKGKTISDQHKQLLSEANKGDKNYFYGVSLNGELNGFYGKKHREETKLKMKENHIDMLGEKHPMYGKFHSDETKIKIGMANRGRKVSDEFKDRCREVNLGANNHNATKVVCDGFEFGCIRELSDFYNIPYSTIRGWLNCSCRMPQEFIDISLRYLGDKHTVYEASYRCLKSYTKNIEDARNKIK